jgi:hypothetical protein
VSRPARRLRKSNLESLIQTDFLEDFVGEVTRWHLRRERDRFARSLVAPDIMAALAVAQELKPASRNKVRNCLT